MERTCLKCSVSYPGKRVSGSGRISPYCETCRMECSVASCNGSRVSKSSQCSFHKSRTVRRKAFDAPRRAVARSVKPECATYACAKPVHAQALCRTHYLAAAKRGDCSRLYVQKRNARGREHNGYQEVPHPTRPAMVSQHRLVMEQALGRPLRSFETVHHKNGRRGQNDLSNLELWTKPQPAGQRPQDLAAWVVEHYPELVEAELRTRQHDEQRGQLRLVVA